MRVSEKRTPGGHRADADQSTNNAAIIAPSGLAHMTVDQGANRAAVEQHDKHFKTLQAELAGRGYQLHIISAADGTSAFLVQRWGLVRELPDLAAVARFLEQAGAR